MSTSCRLCYCGTGSVLKRQCTQASKALTAACRMPVYAYVRAYASTGDVIGVTSDEGRSNDVVEQARAKLDAIRSKAKQRPTATTTTQRLSAQSQERAVPSSRLARMANYGSLAAGLGLGALTEGIKKQFNLSTDVTDSRSAFLSKANIERIVATLCKVRGAALKFGQMISIQDGTLFPKDLVDIFDRVRAGADYMPQWQVEAVLEAELGKNWRSKMKSIEMRPFAAASIGQVHQVVTHNDVVCAMKVQYPGVAESIDNDIDTLLSIMVFSRLLPEGSPSKTEGSRRSSQTSGAALTGLFLEKAASVARKELAWEVDYIREANCAKKFKELLAGDPNYFVPEVIPELSTKRILTSELIQGIPLDKVVQLDQDTRNRVSKMVLELCLRELFEFRFMQTDPNWSNFFYNQATDQVSLLDFGASIEYKKKFVDSYIKVIRAASVGDRVEVERGLKVLGFLTGYETRAVAKAHVEAVMILGEPFAVDAPFDFATQGITGQIQNMIPEMLNRLTPPPEESYSLHRKMSGAFLLCTKLKAKINCRPMFDKVWNEYKFD